MRRNSRHNEEEAQINITPMLDIVFIMLIFFIVTTSFVKEISIDVSRPSNAPPKKTKISQVIAVRIGATGDIQVQGRLTDIRAVRANISTALAQKPEASVVVVSHRDADSGVLVSVIDQARTAGAEKVSLASETR